MGHLDNALHPATGNTLHRRLVVALIASALVSGSSFELSAASSHDGEGSRSQLSAAFAAVSAPWGPGAAPVTLGGSTKPVHASPSKPRETEQAPVDDRPTRDNRFVTQPGSDGTTTPTTQPTAAPPTSPTVVFPGVPGRPVTTPSAAPVRPTMRPTGRPAPTATPTLGRPTTPAPVRPAPTQAPVETPVSPILAPLKRGWDNFVGFWERLFGFVSA